MATDNTSDRPFRWEDLDQRILSHKTSEIAEEMHRRTAEGTRRIAFETSQKGNSSGYWPELMAFHEKLANEWAEKTYLAYCQTLELQGGVVSPAFIRAVRDHAIAQVLAARKSTVIGEFSMWHMRTRRHPNAMQARSWCLRMDRLTAYWRGKLEAEAAAAEYRASPALTSRDSSELQNYHALPSTWNEFYQAFRALSEEEAKAAQQANKGDLLLRGYLDYADPNLRYGDFQFGGGINETFKARFVVFAMSAARNLGANTLDGPPLNVWFHNLFQDLRQQKSDLLFAPSETGAIISRVCEASALYCLRLQTKALEQDQTASNEKPSTRMLQSRRPGPSPLRPFEFVDFAGTLWVKSKGGSRRVTDSVLLQIAATLDERKFLPPTKYLERRYAQELKRFNSKNANSKIGPIGTWTRLVQIADKDLVRGMRRMLSRCASSAK